MKAFEIQPSSFDCSDDMTKEISVLKLKQSSDDMRKQKDVEIIKKRLIKIFRQRD